MRLIFILFFFLNLNLRARYAPQIKDFLCGCDYCETVLPGEPLVIGRHMIMCDSWRESTMNTFRIMQEMKQQKSAANEYDVNGSTKNNGVDSNNNINNDDNSKVSNSNATDEALLEQRRQQAAITAL